MLHKLDEWVMSHFFDLIILLSVVCLVWVILNWIMA